MEGAKVAVNCNSMQEAVSYVAEDYESYQIDSDILLSKI